MGIATILYNCQGGYKQLQNTSYNKRQTEPWDAVTHSSTGSWMILRKVSQMSLKDVIKTWDHYLLCILERKIVAQRDEERTIMSKQMAVPSEPNLNLIFPK